MGDGLPGTSILGFAVAGAEDDHAKDDQNGVLKITVRHSKSDFSGSQVCRKPKFDVQSADAAPR